MGSVVAYGWDLYLAIWNAIRSGHNNEENLGGGVKLLYMVQLFTCEWKIICVVTLRAPMYEQMLSCYKLVESACYIEI